MTEIKHAIVVVVLQLIGWCICVNLFWHVLSTRSQELMLKFNLTLSLLSLSSLATWTTNIWDGRSVLCFSNFVQCHPTSFTIIQHHSTWWLNMYSMLNSATVVEWIFVLFLLLLLLLFFFFLARTVNEKKVSASQTRHWYQNSSFPHRYFFLFFCFFRSFKSSVLICYLYFSCTSLWLHCTLYVHETMS